MSPELSPIVSGSRRLRHQLYDVDVPTSHIGSGDRAGVWDLNSELMQLVTFSAKHVSQVWDIHHILYQFTLMYCSRVMSITNPSTNFWDTLTIWMPLKKVWGTFC